MTITEFMDQMAARWPRYAGEISAWAGSYNRKLGHLVPGDLRNCWESTVDSWTGGGYPKPEDFAKHAPAPDRSKIDGGKIDAELKRRNSELRGWIDRTFQHNSVAIEQRAANYPNEPYNLYRACVTTKLEFMGKSMPWYVRYQPAPHHHEMTDDDYAAVQVLVAACEARKFWRPGGTDPAKERARQRAIEASEAA